MAKIGYSVGLTYHIGAPSNNEYIKLTLSVDEVDTEIDFDEQLEKIHNTAHQLMEWGEETMGQKMMEALEKK